MTEDLKKICNEEINKNGWNKLGIIEPSPSVLVWNKEVLLMYEDMDGVPCTCRAKYVVDGEGKYFVATDGAAIGNRMGNCIAYKDLN